MGLTYVDGTVTGPSGISREVRFLVDSGSSYTLLPGIVWKALGISPRRTLRIRLADGTELQRPLGEARVSVEFGDTATPVILGEDNDAVLLGAITLEELGLVLDPFSRALRPMRVLMPSAIEGTVEPTTS